MSISANKLKTKGVSAIETGLGQTREVIITVRGKERFVVMDMEHYNYLRECELEAALHQARADVNAGDFITESVDDHIKRVIDEI
ncbi:MAG: type II toxin-antitoxin system prevent-host-death family antitoxin [Dissulfuribacterales bacterium]